MFKKIIALEGSTCFRPNTPIIKNCKKYIDPSRLALPTSPNTHVVPKYITENQKKKKKKPRKEKGSCKKKKGGTKKNEAGLMKKNFLM